MFCLGFCVSREVALLFRNRPLHTKGPLCSTHGHKFLGAYFPSGPTSVQRGACQVATLVSLSAPYVPLIENVGLSLYRRSRHDCRPPARSLRKGAIMKPHVTHRSFIALVATAFLTLLISLAQAEPLTPKTVKAGTSPTLTVNSSGFFELSRLTASQVSVSPATGVSNIRIGNPTAQSATVTFDLASTAPAGQRMLVINAGDVTVSIKFIVEPGVTPVCTARNCLPPRVCDGNACVLPACGPANCRPPRFCDDGICIRPPICNPRCTPPKRCEAGNICRIPQ
jgi:hypothetical protein